jgi:hypothetical protein
MRRCHPLWSRVVVLVALVLALALPSPRVQAAGPAAPTPMVGTTVVRGSSPAEAIVRIPHPSTLPRVVMGAQAAPPPWQRDLQRPSRLPLRVTPP